MPDRDQLVWLFFRLSGRASRAAYILAFLLLVIVQVFCAYRVMLAPEASTSLEVWSFALLLSIVGSLWSHVALSVKRLHDFGKPGIIAIVLFIPIVSIVAFLVLCIIPGDPGPNRYAKQTNSAT